MGWSGFWGRQNNRLETAHFAINQFIGWLRRTRILTLLNTFWACFLKARQQVWMQWTEERVHSILGLISAILVFSLLSRAEKKKQANGKLWNVTYSLLKWRGSIPFNFIFMCKFLLCSLSSLVLWVFPQALFVISSEMFIAETCLLLCNCVYPFCLIHVHTRKIKPWMFEM